MKTKFAIAAIALALSSSAVFAAPQQQVGGGEVTFNGKVTASSCTVSLDGQKGDATVTLSDVNVAELANDQYIKPKAFEISVSDCSVVGAGFLTADWTATDLLSASKGYLKNVAADDAAANVGIGLLGVDLGSNGNTANGGNAVVPNTSKGQQYAGRNATFATFKYTANYVTEDAASVTPGNVKAVATYVINYQ